MHDRRKNQRRNIGGPGNGFGPGYSAGYGSGYTDYIGSSGQASQMPVYHISVVAEMVETHPQTLRMYERMGLVAPRRTRNNIRLYSDADVEQVRRIQHLTQELGVNLAGVEVVFKLLREMERIRAEVAGQMDAIREEIERETEAMLHSRLRAVGIEADVLSEDGLNRHPADGHAADAQNGAQQNGDRVDAQYHQRFAGPTEQRNHDRRGMHNG